MRDHAMRVALVVALGLLAACSDGPGELPKVPTFKRAATTTTDVDYANVGLRGVTGRSATTVAIGPGSATITGIVPAATARSRASVNVERIVDGGSASVIVLTAEDGTWTVPSVLGGRYRIRAWRAPDLAQTVATGVFLGASETKTVDLNVHQVDSLSVLSSLAPDPPTLDRPGNLVVLVSRKTVGDDGVVRATPIEGVRLDLIGSSGWRVYSSNPETTDSNGRAQWLVQCQQEGRQPLAVSVFGEQTVPLTINDCVDPVVVETTTTTDEFGNPPPEEPSTTTTTCRRTTP